MYNLAKLRSLWVFEKRNTKTTKLETLKVSRAYVLTLTEANCIEYFSCPVCYVCIIYGMCPAFIELSLQLSLNIKVKVV